MPRSRTSSIAIALALGAALAWSLPSAAQQEESFPGPDPEQPYTGYTRGDGTVVLDDASFCRYLLGATLGQEPLTRVQLLDKSKKQKKARGGAFKPDGDPAVLARCTDALAAFRTAPPTVGPDGDAAATPDPIPAWARRAPVVPEAFVSLLRDDLVAQPLASTDQVWPAARTSGFGDLVSPPFSITPGPWLAELHAVACDAWAGTLRNARDPERSFPLESTTREYLYELEGGYYYWDVSASDCDWSVDLVPVVLGPDPTPTPEPRAVVPALHGPDWNRYPDAPNADWLTATQAREAVLAAGLTTGTCHQEGANKGDRVWQQEPAAGALVEFGTPVEVWVERDCDVYEGDRVIVDG